MAEQDEMFDPVTPQQDEPMPGIDGRNLDDRETAFRVFRFSPKGGGYANAPQPEPAQRKR
jgi:hypothetical protein